MAKLVTIIGITHNPFMPRLFQAAAAASRHRQGQRTNRHDAAKAGRGEAGRADYDRQRPSASVFMDNMPPFMIGKMDAYDGTFYDETREFGLPTCKLPGDSDLSDYILGTRLG